MHELITSERDWPGDWSFSRMYRNQSRGDWVILHYFSCQLSILQGVSQWLICFCWFLPFCFLSGSPTRSSHSKESLLKSQTQLISWMNDHLHISVLPGCKKESSLIRFCYPFHREFGFYQHWITHFYLFTFCLKIRFKFHQ